MSYTKDNTSGWAGLIAMPLALMKAVVNNPMKSALLYLSVFHLEPADAFKIKLPTISVPRLPQIPAPKKHWYCGVEEQTRPGIPEHKDCWSYLGGEAGRVSCALFGGPKKGTVYYGDCAEPENQKRLGLSQ